MMPRKPFSRDDAAPSPLTMKILQDWVRRAAAPARAIQELAGHQDIGTTQRYMHLHPSAVESAIRPLDRATN